MNIIDNYLFVLIPGMLSLTIIEGRYNQNEINMDLLEGLLEIVLNSGNPADFYGIENSELEIFEKVVKKSCQKNGGPKTYDVAKDGWYHFLNCTQNAYGINNRRLSYPKMDDFFMETKNDCDTFSNAKYCAKRLTDSIQPCLNLEEHAVMAKIYNVVISLGEFICESDAARVTNFLYNGDGLSCVQSNKLALENCVGELVGHYDSIKQLYGNPTATDIMNFLIYFPESKDCINIEEFQYCTVKILKRCEHYAPADIADSFFNWVKKTLNCAKLYKSEASLSSLVDIVLINTVMMAIMHSR